ncbi:MAG: hypothetical protein K8R13_01170, partial [Methanococcoides sp.]|nr:hypothetical protein [Methanococcoides sp.]
LVHMPEFSEHEIIIELEPESESESVENETEPADETEDAATTPAFEVLFAVVALGAAYKLKRR